MSLIKGNKREHHHRRPSAVVTNLSWPLITRGLLLLLFVLCNSSHTCQATQEASSSSQHHHHPSFSVKTPLQQTKQQRQRRWLSRLGGERQQQDNDRWFSRLVERTLKPLKRFNKKTENTPPPPQRQPPPPLLRPWSYTKSQRNRRFLDDDVRQQGKDDGGGEYTETDDDGDDDSRRRKNAPAPSSKSSTTPTRERSNRRVIDDDDDDDDEGEEQQQQEGSRVTEDEDYSPSSSSLSSSSYQTTTTTTPAKKNSSTRSSWSALMSLVQSQKSIRLARATVSGLQLGLIVYLVYSAWKVVDEVIQDISQELSSSDTTTSAPAFCKRDQVACLLEFLETTTTTPTANSVNAPNNQEEDKSSSSSSSSSSTKDAASNGAVHVPLSLFQLAHKLLRAGLPLRSTATASVESVLSQLSRSEASLLEQALWMPPQQQQPPIVLSSSSSSKKYDDDDATAALHHAWNEIAGLLPVKEQLLSTLATVRSRQLPLSMQQPQQHHHHQNAYASLFDSPSQAATGILLYGPPGCGKTMLVRALATTARIPTLVVTPSILLRKYVGETNEKVRSLFSLATKLAPCILCIDELDGLFRERSESEHEVSRELKTEFLQWWDGMLSSSESHNNVNNNNNRAAAPPILVIGCSNRPFDVDAAVLRRLSQTHYVGMPDLLARSVLLKQLLQNVPTDDPLNIHRIALETQGYSPSDLRQLLQTAALLGPMAQQRRRQRQTEKVALLSTDDILQAISKSPPTRLSHSYRTALNQFVQQSNHGFDFNSNKNLPMAMAYDDDGTMKRWETDHGSFYHIGTLELDHSTFDALTDLTDFFVNQLQEQDLESSHDEDDDDDDIF